MATSPMITMMTSGNVHRARCSRHSGCDSGTALDGLGAVVGHCRRRMRIRLVKAKITATVTVIRSRFFSTTVEPAAAEPTEPPNMSESPPPLPLCMRMRKISAKRRQYLQYDDDCGQHPILPPLTS